MKIGMIGLGRMGSGIVDNFIRNGHEVMVYDLAPAAMEKFVGRAGMAGDLRELLAANEMVGMVLPGSPEVEAVTDEFLAAGVAGKIVVDFSTSYPMSTRRIFAKFREKGGRYCDISMSGSPVDSANATFDLLYGGDPALFEELRPVIEKICKKFYNCGGPGAGNCAKLLTNHLSAVLVALYGEIFALAEKMDFDTSLLHEINSNGACDSGFYQFIAPKLIHHDYQPSFALDFCIKDLTYLKRLFDEFKANAFVLDGGLNMFRDAHSMGYGSHDCSEVMRSARRSLGLE